MHNPFAAWFHKQSYHVTQTELAKELHIDRTYVTVLMRETNDIMPSLPVALAIEKLTGGAVTPRIMHDFVASNRSAKVAA